MARVITVLGTWGLADDEWWYPHAPLVTALRERGHEIVSPQDPFFWCGGLEGVFGQNEEWEAGGAALRWFCDAKGVVSPTVIAHSHGGQVVAYAAAQGLRIRTLLTLATPCREDMDSIWFMARQHIGTWVHVYGDRADWMVRLGALFDKRLGTNPYMRHADKNVVAPSESHKSVLLPATWDRFELWKVLNQEGGDL